MEFIHSNLAGVARQTLAPPQGAPETINLSQGQIFSPALSRPSLDAIAAAPALLNDLESDLSLISFNPQRDELTLIRDAVGATPLFYAFNRDGSLASAFSLPALFPLLDWVPTYDEETLFDFLATHYRYIFREPTRSFYKGVFQVPAGHFLRFLDGKAELQKWLRLPHDPQAALLSAEEAGTLYLERLRENVRLRLDSLAESAVAFTVSSGLDSSTVASLAGGFLGKPLDAYYMAYRSSKGTPYDETEGVLALTRAKGWKLTRLDLEAPDLLKDASALMEITLAPVATVTWLAHFKLAQRIRGDGFDRYFSGLGGDESLAGEFEHFFLFFADLFREGQSELLEKETQAWSRLHDHPVFRKNSAVRDSYFARNINFTQGAIKTDLTRYEQNLDYFHPDWARAFRDRPSPPMPTPYRAFLSNRLYQEMSYETSPPTMWSEALSSQAAGIKGLFPMASPWLFSFALSLPGTVKYRDGLTKWPLRLATRGILPETTRLNPVKTGFNAPLDLFLREKKVADEVFDLLLSSELPRLGWITPASLHRVKDEHLSETRDHMSLVWPLLSAALFLEKLKRRAASPPLP
ncbi:MAG: asparagine synthase [Deltaproteobacteria bacterium]|jgi:asparagine synthase (glutamine-hydrolysing)|nr:asparagine synthase [Deltaproteobacteria bacterium]